MEILGILGVRFTDLKKISGWSCMVYAVSVRVFWFSRYECNCECLCFELLLAQCGPE